MYLFKDILSKFSKLHIFIIKETKKKNMTENVEKCKKTSKNVKYDILKKLSAFYCESIQLIFLYKKPLKIVLSDKGC